MAEKAVPRVTRLLGIVAHLEQHGEATFAELAEHFGVSEYAIKRDVDTLWVSGLPGHGTNELLDFDPWAYDDGVARIVESQGVHQVRLGALEGAALLGALRVLIASGAAPEAASTARDKLELAPGEHVAVEAVPAASVRPEALDALRAGLEAGTCVDVDYIDARDNRTARRIEPHRLVTVDGIGYVECYCQRARDYRTLRLDRIASAQATEKPVTQVAADRLGFDLPTQYSARVRVRREHRWALDGIPGASVEADGDVVTVTFDVAREAFAVERLLAAAPGLVSVEPARLATALAEAADAVLAVHADAAG